MLVVYDATGEIVAANDDADGTLQSEVSYTVERRRLLRDGLGFARRLSRRTLSTPRAAPAPAPKEPYDLTVTADQPTRLLRRPPEARRRTRWHDLGQRGRHSRAQIRRRRPGRINAGCVLHLPDRVAAARAETRRGLCRRRGRSVRRLDGRRDGAYQMHLEVYRPGSEYAKREQCRRSSSTSTAPASTPRIFGGPGQSTLSPLASSWPMGPARLRQNKLINRVVATVKENIRQDLDREWSQRQAQGQRQEQPRPQGPVRQAERVAGDHRRNDRPVGRRHHRNRAVDRSWQLRP